MQLFMPFCWIHAFLIYKGRGREDGVEGARLLNCKISDILPVINWGKFEYAQVAQLNLCD